MVKIICVYKFPVVKVRARTCNFERIQFALGALVSVMVKILPEINFLKANNAGNLDAIADGQAKLYKREHYHPLLSLIPLAIQIILLQFALFVLDNV